MEIGDDAVKAPEVEKNEVESEEKVKEQKIDTEHQSLANPNLSYPQRFKKKIIGQEFSKFLEIFYKNQINFPFVDSLKQMPKYAKYLKDVISKKRKL